KVIARLSQTNGVPLEEHDGTVSRHQGGGPRKHFPIESVCIGLDHVTTRVSEQVIDRCRLGFVRTLCACGSSMNASTQGRLGLRSVRYQRTMQRDGWHVRKIPFEQTEKLVVRFDA